MSKRFRYNFISDMLGEDEEEILRFYTKKTKKNQNAQKFVENRSLGYH